MGWKWKPLAINGRTISHTYHLYKEEEEEEWIEQPKNKWEKWSIESMHIYILIIFEHAHMITVSYTHTHLYTNTTYTNKSKHSPHSPLKRKFRRTKSKCIS